jgi:hypothetical protein
MFSTVPQDRQHLSGDAVWRGYFKLASRTVMAPTIAGATPAVKPNSPFGNLLIAAGTGMVVDAMEDIGRQMNRRSTGP